MQQLLNDARNALIHAHRRLEMFRRIGQLNSNDFDLLHDAEQDFLSSLDRVWDLQCMVGGAGF